MARAIYKKKTVVAVNMVEKKEEAAVVAIEGKRRRKGRGQYRECSHLKLDQIYSGFLL